MIGDSVKYRILGLDLMISSVLLCSIVTLSFAQETGTLQDTLFLDVDYLLSRSYESLMDMEDEAYGNKSLQRLRVLTEVHARKAKNGANPIELANAYYYRTIIEEPELAVSYADSMILATKDSDHSEHPTFGFILKAIIYYDKRDYQLAMQNYITAYNLAVNKMNLEDQITCSMAIAAIRNLNGQPHAAADIYTRTLKLLKKEKDYEHAHYQDYMLLMYNLSLAHLRLSQLDSSRQYYNAGLEKAITNNDSIEYRDFVLVGAQLDYYENDIQKARDTLLKYTHLLEGNSRAMKLYYLGKIAQQTGNNNLAIRYFQQIDSIVKETNKPFDAIKDVYQQLVMHYGLNDDQQREIESIEKLIYFDSLMTTEQKGIIQQATVAYDLPYLKQQKTRAEEQLEAKSSMNLVLVIMTGIAFISGLYFYFRARKTKKIVRRLLQDSKSVKSSSKKVGVHTNSVPEDIRNDLLMKLEAFEKSDLYLSKDLDMAQLAQEMDSNTTYLSTIVNHYKEMSFPNYLKDLKITYAIEMLSKDPQLLKYNYQGLADTFGFKTGESFSKAFYAKTGVYPSKLLKELKNRESARHL
ncbi:helix-turn-helix domain-containing protein [Arenibacter algicola]|uniref:Helix-turn-helix domain protein n=1 Tax=Arenibacter algicola TaxID=616991 RepID=A0A221UTZ7_9FLAO|nr:helix-turn-helix domain-containing protein [Arenibacter algicola]ASO04566.1 helix-turn-helix domain protein [Arenibacter algicola]